MNEPIREYYENGNIESEKYYINGNIRSEIYYNIDNKLHRDDGPAWIGYHKNGNIEYEEYCINGEKHRKDNPACIYYYENGDIGYKKYYIDGLSHREDGPAHIYYNKNCLVSGKGYFINNICLTNKHSQYKHNLSKQIIKDENDINKLMIMKIVCIEKSYKKLLELVDNKIITLKLSK